MLLPSVCGIVHTSARLLQPSLLMGKGSSIKVVVVGQQSYLL